MNSPRMNRLGGEPGELAHETLPCLCFTTHFVQSPTTDLYDDGGLEGGSGAVSSLAATGSRHPSPLHGYHRGHRAVRGPHALYGLWGIRAHCFHCFWRSGWIGWNATKRMVHGGVNADVRGGAPLHCWNAHSSVQMNALCRKHLHHPNCVNANGHRRLGWRRRPESREGCSPLQGHLGLAHLPPGSRTSWEILTSRIQRV